MANFVNTAANQIDIAQRFNDCENICSTLNNRAAGLYERRGDWTYSLAARILSIMQVIVSIVVVPLSLLAMIFLPPIILFTHDKMAARTCMSLCATLAGGHLFRIPECLIGAIFPSTLTPSLEDRGQVAMVQLGQVQGLNPQRMPQGFQQGFQGIDPQQFMDGFGGLNMPRGLFGQN